MKILLLRLALLFAALASFAAVARADASIQGILITASNEPGKTDARLAEYEPTLRRILRFESYHFVGEDSARLAIPAEGSLSLGDDHQLEVATEKSEGRSLGVKVRWTRAGHTLMNTGLALRPGVPAVLGGPAGRSGEVYAVILIGR